MIKIFGIGLIATSIIFLAGCKWPCCCCNHHEQTQATKSEPVTTQKIAKETPLKATSIVEVATQEAFEKEVLQADKPVIVDFFAEWCHYCKTSKPHFEKTAAQLGASYKFVTANADSLSKVTLTYEIRGLPTFVIFNKGKEVDRIVGAITQESLTNKINALFKK